MQTISSIMANCLNGVTLSVKFPKYDIPVKFHQICIIFKFYKTNFCKGKQSSTVPTNVSLKGDENRALE
jgi:hypothetical protein